MANIKELFPEFYQSDLNLTDLGNKSNNLIVLDTNYLLDIIQLPTTVSKKYIEALEKVKKNIYIPYLVALEFNFKKSSIKKNKIRRIKTYGDNINNSVDEIKKSIEAVDLVDSEEQEAFTKEIIEMTDEYSSDLKKLLNEKISSMITKEEESLYSQLIDIIEDRIGVKYEQEWIDEVQKEGEKRYKEEIPPGYNDSTKDDEKDSTRLYGDLKYQRKYGDLLIWKDIINHSKSSENKGKKVIFITNDGRSNKKNDLLYRADGLIVGPNIYLMNELQRESDKELYILSNLRFVQLVNKLSDSEINELRTFSEPKYRVKIPYEQIEGEVKRLEKLNSSDDKYHYGINSEGYLYKKEKGSQDKIYDMDIGTKKAILNSIHKKLLREQEMKNYTEKFLRNNLLESDDYEELAKNKNILDTASYLEEYLLNNDFRKRELNHYKSIKEGRDLEDEID
ncbi:PIN-like domain-containing protein [Alkalibacterium sp. f15]|uniref:PIN-like domain-containing protein n=1 Tax=Alkalibacterium sp. f15 TaxID=3414029 RepID=UPI003BF8CA5D